MKPTGPIPAAWRADDRGWLCVGDTPVDQLVERAGDTPLFLYDAGQLTRRVAALRAAIPDGLGIHYAMKANPFAPLLRHMAGLVDGFDIASGGELAMALDAGMAADRISFAGPGKRDRELDAAIRAGVTLNTESEGEVARALRIGDAIGIAPRLAVRVNPSFDLKGSGMRMGGGAKPFGVDADRAAALARDLIAAGADWRGWHIFAGSQALDAASLIETQTATVALAAELADAVGETPPVVNLGGGFGVPYFAGDVAVDVAQIGDALSQTLAQRRPILADTHFAIELGRWLVAEAGIYVTRVLDRKVSHDATFLVVDGGLHHQLAASGNFGTVVRRNYPIAVAHRFGAAAQEEVSVVGCLCTPLDRLGDAVGLPRADVGDLVVVFLAGAYGASASPATFLGQGAAGELLV